MYIGRFIIWAVCFIFFGNLLFGCAASKEAQTQWGSVAREQVKQQGLTDRALINSSKKQEKPICNTAVPEKIPPRQSPSQGSQVNVPKIKTTTTTEPYDIFDSDGNQTTTPATIVELEKVDHAALAILQLGKIAEILAIHGGARLHMGVATSLMNNQIGPNVTSNNDSQKQKRIVYSPVPQPKQETVSGVISSVGNAVSKWSWIGDVLKTWFVVDGFVNIAKVPSQTGDNISDSYNPIKKTTTTTTLAE